MFPRIVWYAAAAVLAFSLPAPAHSLDTPKYRELTRQSLAPQGLEDQLAANALYGYLSGIAEMVAVYRSDKRAFTGVCIPRGVPVTAELIKVAIDNELKNAAVLADVLGGDWESYQVAMIAHVGLIRMFPCQR
jgi:hypothetical protein